MSGIFFLLDLRVKWKAGESVTFAFHSRNVNTHGSTLAAASRID